MPSNIREKLEESIKKIKTYENYIAISMHRENVEQEIVDTAREAKKAKKLIIEVYQLMANELNDLKHEYNAVMAEIKQKKAMVMQYVLKKERQKVATAEAAASSQPKKEELEINTPKSKQQQQQTPNILQTPKMSIKEYKQSPFINRGAPVPISFNEFEVKITLKQFEAIPKYMRGRENIDELNQFLETVIIPCFTEKYELLHRKRSGIRNTNELQLWTMYNEQASYIPGQLFITEGDISRRLSKVISKKLRDRITMLRHIAILKEQNVRQTVCYVWRANSI